MKYNPVSLVDVAAQLGFLTINFFGRNPSTALVWKTTLVPAANCKLFSCFLFPSFQNLAWSWALHSSNHNSLIFDVGTKNVIPNLDLDFFQLRPVRWLARQAPIRGYYRSPQYTIGAFVLAASDLPFDKILSFIIQFWDIFVQLASVHFKHNTSQGCPFLCVSSWIWLG